VREMSAHTDGASKEGTTHIDTVSIDIDLRKTKLLSISP
jgi:hypothetical protein